ncbi:DUF6382 domain-containing protein [Paenibacillus donghaensis]|uniref:FHA domain-containing protein n=1 Tax=Paenibacillus donghaensis TaxID=414771 RepID=A0A2Z2K8F7_9BACL|nr:DUF6382 domain-containing protein [Paenibacillus donghaensis]ASA19555.1 hypothetical protein B9T62_01200 [Paenibacillus donghaensis]
MFGLTRDFMQQDGIYMMLGEPGGLPADRLNRVQARMLMNAGIPQHLRLLLKEVDMRITLEYAVSRKKMLSHLLKSEKLSMAAFFGLLLQIAQGMEDGRLYMLRAEQYALHADYIFIEGPLQTGKVYLTYIPLEEKGAGLSPGEGFKDLIIVLMGSISELAGGGVQRLLHYCGEEAFTPAGLKSLLSELLTEGEPLTRQPYVDPQPASAPALEAKREAALPQQTPPAKLPERVGVNSWSGLGRTAGASGEKPEPVPQQTASWMNGYTSMRMREEEQPAAGPKEEVKGEPQASGYRTYVVLGCLLADAALWKFLYLQSPDRIGLLICGAVTVLLLVFSWLVWKGTLTLRRENGEDEEGGSSGEPESGERPIGRKELEWNFGRYPVVPARSAVRAQPEGSALTSLSVADPAPLAHSFFAQQPVDGPLPVAATTVLSREKPPEESKVNDHVKAALPFLTRCDEQGETERIELNRTSFIIGRSAEVAQYVEISDGTSRVHAEIARGPVGYVLKDLDSRNGTLFEGEPMIPYKEYALTEGASFTIVNGIYTFHNA